jgi:tRNA (guanine37-N1)-methyltransferase
MVVCDTVLRKLPGALGHEESAVEESFSAVLGGAPEYPHYTRPAEYRGWRVPEVLLSGHHARIREWRLEQSRRRGTSALDTEAPPVAGEGGPAVGESGPVAGEGGPAAREGGPLP